MFIRNICYKKFSVFVIWRCWRISLQGENYKTFSKMNYFQGEIRLKPSKAHICWPCCPNLNEDDNVFSTKF